MSEKPALSVSERITAYLFFGGLNNPELANHDQVSILLRDARDEIDRLRAKWHGLTGQYAEDAVSAVPDESQASALGQKFIQDLYDGIVTDGPCIAFHVLEGDNEGMHGQVTAFGLGVTILKTLTEMKDKP